MYEITEPIKLTVLMGSESREKIFRPIMRFDVVVSAKSLKLFVGFIMNSVQDMRRWNDYKFTAAKIICGERVVGEFTWNSADWDTKFFIDNCK